MPKNKWVMDVCKKISNDFRKVFERFTCYKIYFITPGEGSGIINIETTSEKRALKILKDINPDAVIKKIEKGW